MQQKHDCMPCRSVSMPCHRRIATVQTSDAVVGGAVRADDTAKYVLKSPDFGVTWNWTVFPAHLQAVTVLAVDPTDAT